MKFHSLFFSSFFSFLFLLHGEAGAQASAGISPPAAGGEAGWILPAALLIFFMQGGMILVEAGFARAQDAGHAAVKNLLGFTVGSLGFVIFGFGLLFGPSFAGLFGAGNFFFSFLTPATGLDNGGFGGMIYQAVFAAAAATLASGALSGRARLTAYIFYSALIGIVLYPVMGHWLWGGGWLGRMGAVDFAGASVVHSLGGWVSLAAILVLGPRLGRFNRNGSANFIPGHNLPLAGFGVFILWFGWFGFNLGNPPLASHGDIGLAAINTVLAGGSGGLSTLILTRLLRGKPEAGKALNGVLSGLVASSGGAAWFTPLSAVWIGVLSGPILLFSLRALERLKLDDPVGAVSVYGANGVWGTIAVGLFAQAPYARNLLGHPLNGLFFGGGLDLLALQALTVLTVFLGAFPLSYGFFRLLDAVLGLRVTAEQEAVGLDRTAYGLSSYPALEEFQKKQDAILEELERVRELSLLRDIGQSVHTLNLDEILELILQGVAAGIGFDRARLYFLDEEKKQLVCRVAVGIDKDKLLNLSLPYDREDNIISRAILDGKPFMVEDAARDPRVNRDLISFLGVKSLAAVPLLSRNKILGGIAADNLISETQITERKLQSLMIFANQAALALENALMYEELKTFSGQLEERVRKATAELEATQRQLFQSEKLAALGKLSAGIAHEIRNPLTSIKILIHSLVDEGATESSREKDLNVIETEIERVNKIIKQFLDFARPRPPSLEPVNPRRLIDETLALVGHEVESQGIRLERAEPRDLPLVAMDPEQMKQVLLNLVLNSLQAMPRGGKLKMTAFVNPPAPEGKESPAVELGVHDSGPGIPPEIRQRIFEPFFSTKDEGIGLGLSVAQRIVEDHGGKIRVESVPGKGTSFLITLPLKKRGEEGGTSLPEAG